MTPTVLTNGGKTGHPPGLLQDDCRKLSKWLASRMNARQEVREVCRLSAQEKTMNDKTEQPVTNGPRCTAAGGHAEIINVPGYPLMVRAVDYNALRAQLAEAQKDSDRLDWIEQNANMGVVINRLKLITDLSRLVYEVAVDDVYVTEDTLRAAIDAAKGESNA